MSLSRLHDKIYSTNVPRTTAPPIPEPLQIAFRIPVSMPSAGLRAQALRARAG